jgi:3-dehydroquinate synthase
MPNDTATSMAQPLKLMVELRSRSYDIHIGVHLLARAGEFIRPFARGRVFIITDANVAARHLCALEQSLTHSHLAAVAPVILPPGEDSKTFAELERLVLALLERGLERADLILALGGGVVGDVAGFAAAIALRGVDFIQIPTTLLAQVDSSIGGKVAVDTAFGKNTAGAFHQPRAVLIDTDLLRTLGPREMRAGYGELMKHALIADEPFFAWLETHGRAVLAADPVIATEAVHKSCAIKARIVAADEREAGPRSLLNLGHTFGHAIEAELGYSGAALHGEAVAIGCRMAATFSARLGFCATPDAHRLERHLESLGIPRRPRDLSLPALDPERLILQMRRDKKVRGANITLVLLRGIGKAFLTRDVEEGALLGFLRDELE